MKALNPTNSGSYATLRDEPLVLLAREGSPAALQILFERYAPLIESRVARGGAGLDRDDLLQEGRIGLFLALLSFDDDKSTLFKTYAGVCITHQIHSARRRADRKKHRPLNTYLPLQSDDFSTSYGASSAVDPVDALIDKENFENIREMIMHKLSDFERKSFTLHLGGSTYTEIAEHLASSPKAVDNALQRVRRKLRTLSI